MRHFAVPRRRVRLGAALDNDLVLPFAGVSRHHATLEPRPEGLLLRDLDSKNGLYWRGERRHEVHLSIGAEVQLGRASLCLERVSSSEAEAALLLDTTSHEPSTAPRSKGATAEVASAPQGGSPEAVVGFVRWLDSARGGGQEVTRRALLDRARNVLGASALATVERSGRGSIAIQDMVGRTPETAVLDALADDQPASALAAGVGNEDRGRELVAFLPPDETSAAPWKRDFLQYVTEVLSRLEAPSGEPAHAIAPYDPDLVLPPEMVFGPSPASQELLNQLRSVVRSSADVLLQGENGTGKELLALAIHKSSSRSAKGPYVPLNCATLPADLLEAELFGILPRVATGVDSRTGVFVRAAGGTLHLDEIGDMAERLQPKLLRVLQEREVLPVGGSRPEKVDVRVVSSTNRDLGRLVEEGRFRADLYYRLCPLELRLPSLRDRLEDLPDLLAAFLSRSARKEGKEIRGISHKALALLTQHRWPGNVRELKQEVDRAVLLCPSGGILESRHFDRVLAAGGKEKGSHRGEETAPSLTPEPAPERSSRRPPASPEAPVLADRVAELERKAILDALDEAQGNKSRAARRLGISRSTLYTKLKSYGLD